MSRRSRSARRAVAVHLIRGAAAACLVGLAIRPPGLAGAAAGLASASAAIGAIGLLRGCPMCWLARLLDILTDPSRRRSPHDRA